MSQAPLPPPIPPRAPQPVHPLVYTDSVAKTRPTAVTVIGVLAIVFGGLGLLSGGAATLVSFSVLKLQSIVAASAPTTPSTPDFAGPKGFDEADRQIIVDAFAAKHPLTAPQIKELSFLLGDVGTRIVPGLSNNNTTIDSADAYERANLTGETGDAVEGGVWFDLPSGRLTVTDSNTLFTPALDSALSPVQRTSIRHGTNPVDPSQLNVAEVQAVIDRVQDLSSTTPLNAAQIAGLRQKLSSGARLLVGAPVDLPDLLSQVRSTSVTKDKTAIVSLRSATLVISPNGVVNSAPSFSGRSPFPKMSRQPLIAFVTGSVLNVALAIYLLVVGIVTLRNTLAARTLLLIYAVVKILVTLLATGAGWWAWHEFWSALSTQNGTSGSAQPNTLPLLMTVAAAFIGCAFPVAVVMLLRTKSVRSFYSVTPER